MPNMSYCRFENTLEALVNKGLAEIKREQGSYFMPRIQIKFRKKGFGR